MEKVLNLVTTEVQNHIRLADLLKDRNEELSRENILLKTQLKDEDMAKRITQDRNERLSRENIRLQARLNFEEIVRREEQVCEQLKDEEMEKKEAWKKNEELSKEIVSMRTQLDKKDNECSVALKEADLFNKLSKEVSKESEHYRKMCRELQAQLRRIEPEADSVISSSVISDFCAAVNSYSEQLGALQEKLDEERQLRLREQIGNIPNDKAYVVYVENEEHKQIFADNKVLLIQDSTDLSSIAANSPKEMFLLLVGEHWKNSNSHEEFKVEFEKILSICQKWKELRPDGEIHVIGWNWWGSSPLSEMRAMFSSYERITFDKVCEKELSIAVSLFWPKYYKQLLSDDVLEEYLS